MRGGLQNPLLLNLYILALCTQYNTGVTMNLYTIVFYSPLTGKQSIEIQAKTAIRARRKIIKKLGRSIHTLSVKVS